MGAYFSISSLIYIIIFMYFFLSKKKIDNVETRVYKYILITTAIGLFFDIFGYFALILGCDPYSVLYQIIAKVMLVYFIAWSFEISYYTYAISYNNEQGHSTARLDKFKSILYCVFLVLLFIIFLFPINFQVSDNLVVPRGFTVIITYGVFAISILCSMVLSFKNSKKIISKKYTPLYLLLLLMVLTFIIQALFPHLFLVNFALSLIVIIMYFTIENPDLKMLRNYHEAKEYAEDLNIEKQMFIYNISQDMKAPLLKISRFCEKLLYSEDIEEYKNGVREIKSESNAMLQNINVIYDIDVKDIRDLSTDNTKYNISNLLKLVVSNMQSKIKETGKKIEFISSISDTIPKELIGDSARLKEVLHILFDNALKHTKEGYIEFKVNEIRKNNICRLMIILEDSGKGIESEKLETLFNRNKIVEQNNRDKIDESKDNLVLAKKIVNILGGNLIVTSELGVGTKISIVLDQEIPNNIDNSLDKYEKTYFEDNKVMIVGTTEEERKILMRSIAEIGGVMETSDNVSELIDNIKQHKKYKIVILDGDLPYQNIAQMIERLKEIKSFNSNLIILSKNKDMKSKKNRAILGVQGYIGRPLSEEGIIEVLKQINNNR